MSDGSTVRCDNENCDWRLECNRQDIPSWHHVPCPLCGQGEIVTDEDMALLSELEALESQNTTLDEHTITIRLNLNSRTFRNNSEGKELLKKLSQSHEV